jgi:pimeloyl-ACP methyl ester carboxylesterase
MADAGLMVTALAHRDDVTIAYERIGPAGGEPLLLVMGLGMQMLSWPDELCAMLADRGYCVVRFDNRDVGESTHWTHAGNPRLFDLLARPKAVAPYRLTDMAADAVAVLDAVGWSSAHVLGASLGGMIAQTLAIAHPDRVRTMTSVMSTPAPQIGRARLSAFAALGIPPATSREEAAERMVRVFTAIGSPAYPRDEQWLRDVGRRAFDRAHDPAGPRRQLAAIRASGDRRAALRSVTAPTLVVHGDADPLIRPAGGRATAAAVPGARLVLYPGMGHDLPRPLWPAMLDEIGTLTGR